MEEAVRAQLVPPKKAELDGFGWMRILRNNTQYPSLEKPLADLDDTLLAQGFADIGANRAALVFEIGVVNGINVPVIVHAMKARDKFLGS